MDIRLFEQSMTDDYTSFVRSVKNSLIYHTVKFKNLLERLLGCESRYLVCLDGGEIVGVMPLMEMDGKFGKIINSLPFFGSNGGILARGEKYSRCLIDEYNRLVEGASNEGNIAAATLIENPFIEQDYSQIRYDYTDGRLAQWTDISCRDEIEDGLMKQIDSSARRNIRKAQKNGIIVKIENNMMESLEKVHNQNMKEINGRTKPPLFFGLLPQYLTEHEDYRIYVARKDGRPVAALLLLYFNGTVEYYIPAIEKDFRSIQPLSLIVYTAMIEASKKGFTRWNWGGTWFDQDGVYRFKKKWKANERKYRYFIKIQNKKILTATPVELMEEYGDFYVIPFRQLHH